MTERSAPALVMVGNPPYHRGRSPSTSDWVFRYMPLFTDPVRKRGALKNLTDSYVYFFRWALWKLFESPPPEAAGGGPRVLGLLTNRTYLHGDAFAGLRAALRRSFDRIWVVDLEGDSRGSRPTANVLGVRVGVCVTVASRAGPTGEHQGGATARYTRVTGTRDEKAHTLARARLPREEAQ